MKISEVKKHLKEIGFCKCLNREYVISMPQSRPFGSIVCYHCKKYIKKWLIYDHNHKLTK